MKQVSATACVTLVIDPEETDKTKMTSRVDDRDGQSSEALTHGRARGADHDHVVADVHSVVDGGGGFRHFPPDSAVYGEKQGRRKERSFSPLTFPPLAVPVA